jgi:hypothetical protein
MPCPAPQALGEHLIAGGALDLTLHGQVQMVGTVEDFDDEANEVMFKTMDGQMIVAAFFQPPSGLTKMMLFRGWVQGAWLDRGKVQWEPRLTCGDTAAIPIGDHLDKENAGKKFMIQFKQNTNAIV